MILPVRSTFKKKNVHITHIATVLLCIYSRETLVYVHACSQTVNVALFIMVKKVKNRNNNRRISKTIMEYPQ